MIVERDGRMSRHFFQAFLLQRFGNAGVVRLQFHFVLLQFLVELTDIPVNEIIDVVTKLNFVVSFFENFIVFPPEFFELSVSPFFLLVFLAIGEKGLLLRLQPIQAVLHC